MNWTAGIAAAASYAVLSVTPSVSGFAAHATHFVMLPVLGGAFLLLNRSDRPSVGRVFAGGLLFGIALLMKQPAAFLILFGAVYLFSHDYRAGLSWRQTILRSVVFNGGAILPFGVTCLLLWRAGVLAKFWFWAIDYARQYGGLLSLSEGARVFLYNITRVIGFSWPLWVLAGIGLVAGMWDKRTRASTVFLSACSCSQHWRSVPVFTFGITTLFWFFQQFRYLPALTSSRSRAY